MADYSIIIPVYNQWELTRSCLKSLAETLHGMDYEVIVVDNASTDVTPKGCPFLGGQLFGGKFHYLRNERNSNFGPASNAGARLANGDFLIFLNNDTVVLPSWLAGLRDDFSKFANLGATGPLLVYPPKPPLGPIIQHLGVYVSPLGRVGHLYEGIPAASPLAVKRRFFQAITAACLMMPRKIFWDLGGFEESYINGFEDVDLCARAVLAGWRLTVNPAVRVIHYQGQTMGRHDSEQHNARIFEDRVQKLLKPDWQDFVTADGYTPGVNAWLKIQAQLERFHFENALLAAIADSRRAGARAIYLPVKRRNESFEIVKSQSQVALKDVFDPDQADRAAVAAAVIAQPFWQKGWEILAESAATLEERLWLDTSRFRLFFGPEGPLDACRAALAASKRNDARIWFNTLAFFYHSVDNYSRQCEENIRVCRENKLVAMAANYENWLANIGNWQGREYADYLRNFQETGKIMLEKGFLAHLPGSS